MLEEHLKGLFQSLFISSRLEPVFWAVLFLLTKIYNNAELDNGSL